MGGTHHELVVITYDQIRRVSVEVHGVVPAGEDELLVDRVVDRGFALLASHPAYSLGYLRFAKGASYLERD